ncbi:MAG TPA: hypothetical protein ENG48_12730 [Candidatus Atribacteria bacterium]|nr:hypothetical protein [Candidatus Atribacteria bacterium]
MILTLFISIGVHRYIKTGESSNIIELAFKVIERRIIQIEASTALFIIEKFPNRFPYFYGYTIWDKLKALLPGIRADFSFGHWLFAEFFAVRGYRGERIGFLPPTFIGEFYANFGLLSIVFLLIWGGLLQLFYIMFIRKCNTADYVILSSIAIAFLGRSALLSFYIPIYVSLFSLFCYLVLFRLPAKIIRNIHI